MKIAFFADLHLGQFQEFSHIDHARWDGKCYVIDEEKGYPINSRLVTTVNCMCDVRDKLAEEGYKTVIFCGDFFHNRAKLDVVVINAAINLLKSYKECGINIISIAGNHDQIDNTIFGQSALSILQDYMTVAEEPISTELYDGDKSIPLMLIPYCKDKVKVVEAINSAPDNAILVAHLGVKGSRSIYGELGGEYDLNDLQNNRFYMVALGHYHNPQKLADNVFYCGTPCQQSFSDSLTSEENNIVILLDTDTDEVKTLQPKAPRFTTVDSPEKIVDGYNFYRVKTKKSFEELKGYIEQGLSNVRFEQEKEYKTEVNSTIGVSNTVQEAIKIWADENNISSKVGEFIYNNKDADPAKVGGIS